MNRGLKVGEVAASFGVSIRTLHHYDQIGLVRPAERGENRYRLYEHSDLLRLQQVLTLRYLGLSLTGIAGIIDRPGFDVVRALKVQRDVLQEQSESLTKLTNTIDSMLSSYALCGEWDWGLVASASSLSASLEKGELMSMSPEEMQQRFAAVASQVSQEEIEAIQNGWLALIPEVRANHHLDPSSPEAQKLADRWQELSDRTAAGYKSDPKLWAAIGEGYKQNQYAEVEGAPNAEDMAFIKRVQDARK